MGRNTELGTCVATLRASGRQLGKDAPMTREETLAEEEGAWIALQDALAAVPAEQRTTEGIVPGWSTHDTVWHLGYWSERSASILESAAEGPPYPKEPEDGSYYDAENDRVFATGRELDWEEITARMTKGRARGRDAIATCGENDLPWLIDRITEEIAHYREHAEQVSTWAAQWQ